MIYTVTLNPSLDYNVKMGSLKTGVVNRTEEEILLPGGKGINVSLELHNLGVATTALGIVAGFTGDEIVRLVKERGVRADFIHAGQGFSRINMKVHHGEDTGINGCGPKVGKEELAALYWRFDMLEEGDVLVLSGSVPSGLSESVYMDIVKYMEGRGVRIVVSTMKSQLAQVLPYHPFLIKPNRHEMEESMGAAIRDTGAVIEYAKKLREQGALNVLAVMADHGVVLVTQDGQELFGTAPHNRVVNMVGAGDALVAGFLAGYLGKGDYREALRLGIAAASASASETEFAKLERIREIAGTVEISG
ncbi:MAG: 1-phosphofructokinase [Lachnospiraceae bacterium]|nr:1-phosphofructokinase [Lachnospiraceae bacterium]